jgi:AcrR family transcriptional regulator
MATLPTTASPARDRILDAADLLLARHGFRRMTMDDLALEAGIGKGTTYLHFRSKEDVALGALDRMVERLLTRLREIGTRKEPAESRLRAMLRERVLHRFDYARPHSKSLDEMLGSLREPFLQRREHWFAAEAECLAAVLDEARRAGHLRLADPPAVARALVLATNALLPYSLSVRELGRRREVERRIDELADLILHGAFHKSTLYATRRPTPR